MKALIVIALMLAACGPKQVDVIAEAQQCLDRVIVPSDAAACVEPLRDNDTRQAQNLKCAAGFVAEGFKDGKKILFAYRQLGDPAQGTLAFFGTMSFASKGNGPENRQYAREIDSYCEAGGQPSFTMLSAISLAATTLSAAGRLQWTSQKPPTKEEVRMAIIALKATRDEPATMEAIREVGSSLMRVFDRSCSQSKLRPPRLCRQIDAALKVSGSNKSSENTADRLLELWLQ